MSKSFAFIEEYFIEEEKTFIEEGENVHLKEPFLCVSEKNIFKFMKPSHNVNILDRIFKLVKDFYISHVCIYAKGSSY